jgi:hypothetical protein
LDDPEKVESQTFDVNKEGGGFPYKTLSCRKRCVVCVRLSFRTFYYYLLALWFVVGIENSRGAPNSQSSHLVTVQSWIREKVLA